MKGKVTRVGFIGLGNMGSPMAVNIARAGFDTAVYDIREEAANQACAAGAKKASSIAEVVKHAEILSSCVLYESQVRELYFAPDGIVANAGSGLVTMIHSTISPPAMRAVALEAEKHGVTVLDAAVTGASERAERGELTSIVSGSETSFELGEEVLAAVSKHVFYVGPQAGQAQIVKLANNLMAHINQLGAMEAVHFAEAQGLDREVVLKVASTGTGGSWASDNFAHFDRLGSEHTLAGTPEMPHRLVKDLRIAVQQAQENWINLPIAGLAAQLGPGMYRERWSKLPRMENHE
jgi:3-hydroxyisobutyrate dehydrogenase